MSSTCTCTGFASCPSSAQRQIWLLAARLSGPRQVRNVCCSRCHWTELFCVPLRSRNVTFPQSGASARPHAGLPQHHHPASPCQCLSHPKGLLWASAHHQEPSPLFLACELIPGVQRRGKTRGTSQQRAAQQLQPGRMKPAGSLARHPTFEGGQPALAGEGRLH